MVMRLYSLSLLGATSQGMKIKKVMMGMMT